MLLTRRAISSSGGEVLRFLFKQNHWQAFSSISSNVIPNPSNTEILQRNCFQENLKRPFHVTVINKDVETGLKAIGAGFATSAIIGPGIGLGYIFGNLLTSIARNPSIANKIFTNAMMGAAFCESLGLFALMIAFVILF